MYLLIVLIRIPQGPFKKHVSTLLRRRFAGYYYYYVVADIYGGYSYCLPPCNNIKDNMRTDEV